MSPVRSIPLEFRPRTRAGWRIASAVCLVFGVASGWALLALPGTWHPIGLVVVAGLAALYLWAGIAALDVSRGHPVLLVGSDVLQISYRGLLHGSLSIPRALVSSLTLDERPTADRRVAASERRGGIAPPSFLDPTIPVLSAYPSSHSRHGAVGAPNLVIFFSERMEFGRIPLMPRFLLRLAQGRAGTYRGPKSLLEAAGLRLVVEDPALARDALRSWGPVESIARDRRYLAPVDDRLRSRALKHRVQMLAVVGAVTLLFGVLSVFQVIARG